MTILEIYFHLLDTLIDLRGRAVVVVVVVDVVVGGGAAMNFQVISQKLYLRTLIDATDGVDHLCRSRLHPNSIVRASDRGGGRCSGRLSSLTAIEDGSDETGRR